MSFPEPHQSTTNSPEDLFVTRFIEALRQDMRSSKHGCQINAQVLNATVDLLQNRHECPQLTLEQMIRGALNMALALQSSKYGIIRPALVGEEKHKSYVTQMKRWFGDYNQALESATSYDYWKIAIPVITRAAKGPLFMMSACVPNTLTVYFDYLKQLDNSFVPPQLPTGDSNFSVIEGTEDWNNFSLEIVNKTDNEERLALKTIVHNLSDKVALLSSKNNISEQVLLSAVTLKSELSDAVELYMTHKSEPGVDKNEAQKLFLAQCSVAIDKAKPILEKELGWGDYLTNLAKLLTNAVIKATNAVTGSNYNFFSYAKTPLVIEVEEIEVDLKNDLSPSK